jgi:hypothetical protein
MAALAALLLDCSKLDLAAFTANLATAEAALRCAVAAGAAAAARGAGPQRSALWSDLLPAAFKAIRKLGKPLQGAPEPGLGAPGSTLAGLLTSHASPAAGVQSVV